MTAFPFSPGLGVFETVRVEEGVPLFFKEHQACLRSAAEALGLPEPDLSALPNLPSKACGRWRWIFADGQAGQFVFTPEAWSEVPPHALELSPLRLGSQNWDARYKTLSYLTHLQARQIAATPEVVLLNEHGQIASAASANLFWVKDGKLQTPDVSAGCRAGVVRGWISRHHPVETGAWPLDLLLDADEIFLTNSLKGVVSISQFAGRAYTSFQIAGKLRQEWRHELARQIANQVPPGPARPPQ